MYIVMYIEDLNVLCARKGAKFGDDYKMKTIDKVHFHENIVRSKVHNANGPIFRSRYDRKSHVIVCKVW